MKTKTIKSPIAEILKGLVGFICQPSNSTKFRTRTGKIINLPIHWMKGGLS